MKFLNIKELQSHEGKEIGKSEWHTITQKQINDFAKATGDFQWIHTDVERAKKDSPFKTTIAHGYLTLSLISKFVFDLLEVQSLKGILNYGANKVRFTSAVPCGSEVRLNLVLKHVEESKTGFMVTFNCVLELKNSEKPAVVTELLAFFIE